jgi:hypothetical protein
MDVVEQAVINALLAKAEAIAALASSEDPPSEPLELQQLRSQLATLQAIPGNNPAINGAVLDLKRQIENFRHTLTQQSEVRQENQELLLRTLGNCSYWYTLPDEKKRAIYKALVLRVIVKDGLVKEVILSGNL